jgi:hypothetical protein
VTVVANAPEGPVMLVVARGGVAVVPLVLPPASLAGAIGRRAASAPFLRSAAVQADGAAVHDAAERACLQQLLDPERTPDATAFAQVLYAHARAVGVVVRAPGWPAIEQAVPLPAAASGGAAPSSNDDDENGPSPRTPGRGRGQAQAQGQGRPRSRGRGRALPRAWSTTEVCC